MPSTPVVPPLVVAVVNEDGAVGDKLNSTRGAGTTSVVGVVVVDDRPGVTEDRAFGGELSSNWAAGTFRIDG